MCALTATYQAKKNDLKAKCKVWPAETWKKMKGLNKSEMLMHLADGNDEVLCLLCLFVCLLLRFRCNFIA